MKKIAVAMLAIVLMVVVSSCSFIKDSDMLSNKKTSPPNEIENSTTEDQTTPIIKKDNSFDAAEVAKNFQVTEYKINDQFHYFAVYVVKNTSEFTLDINGNIEAFNGENIIGAKEGGEYAVPAGKDIVLAYSFDESFTEAKYKFTAQVSSLYVGVTQDLSIDSTSAKNKEIIKVTNNGTHDAEFVQATVLFFKNSKLVFLNSKYICAGDNLKPNESKSAEVSCSISYDSISVFLTGRATR